MMAEKNQRPVFDFKQHHTVDYCSETFIEYLLKDSVSYYHFHYIQICFKLYGHPDLAKKDNHLKKGGSKKNPAL